MDRDRTGRRAQGGTKASGGGVSVQGGVAQASGEGSGGGTKAPGGASQHRGPDQGMVRGRGQGPRGGVWDPEGRDRVFSAGIRNGEAGSGDEARSPGGGSGSLGWVGTQEAEIRVQEIGSLVRGSVSFGSVTHLRDPRAMSLSLSLSHTHTQAACQAHDRWGHSPPAQADPFTQGGRGKGDTAGCSRGQCRSLWPSESRLPRLTSSAVAPATSGLTQRPQTSSQDVSPRGALEAGTDSQQWVTLLEAPSPFERHPGVPTSSQRPHTSCHSARCSEAQTVSVVHLVMHRLSQSVIVHRYDHMPRHTVSHREAYKATHTHRTQVAHMQAPCDTRNHTCATGEQRPHSAVTHAALVTAGRTLSHACTVTNTVPSGTDSHTHTHTQIPVTLRSRHPRNQPQGVPAVVILSAPGHEGHLR